MQVWQWARRPACARSPRCWVLNGSRLTKGRAMTNDKQPGNSASEDFAIKLARSRAGRRLFGIMCVVVSLLFLIPVGFRGWDDIRVFTQFRATTCTIIGKRLTVSSDSNTGSSGNRTSTFYKPEFTMRYEA